MNYDALLTSGVRELPCVRQFQQLFANAEHSVVEAKRDFDHDGWKPVSEWISRASLHNRYVVWLVVAIEITTKGTVSELEEPDLYVVEVEKVEKGRDEEGGPLWECGFCRFEEGDWNQLVENGGDFGSLGLDMTVDAPVDRFATFWHDTRPIPGAAPSDGVALLAPLRFTT